MSASAIFCRGVSFRAFFSGAILFGAVFLAAITVLLPVRLAIAQQTETQKAVHAERILVRGLTFMRTGYPDKAVVIYAEGLKVNPNHPVLLASMSDAQKAIGEFNSALFYLNGALLARPDDIHLHRQALILAVESGNGELAEQASESILRLSPDAPNEYIFLLGMLAGADATSLALPVAESAATRFPGSEEILRATLQIFRQAGNLTRVEWAARKILELTRDSDDRFELAKTLIITSQFDDAADELISVLTEDPSHAEALLSLSSVQAYLPDRTLDSELPAGISLTSLLVTEFEGRTDSLEVYRAMAVAAPQDDGRALQLADYLYRSGEYLELSTLTAEQLERNPRQIRMWILAIQSNVLLQHWDEATRVAEDAVLLFPGHEPFEIELVEVLVRTERFSEAMELARGVLERVDGDGSGVREDDRADRDRLLRLIAEMNEHQ